MGRLRRSRTHKAQRDVHRASRTRVYFCLAIFCTPRLIFRLQARTKDLDQIQLIDLDPKVHFFLASTLTNRKTHTYNFWGVEPRQIRSTSTRL